MKPLLAATAIAAMLAVSPLASAQTPNSPTSAQPQWYTQHGNELRASKLIGSTVQNDAKESIGKINEVVLGKDGKVAAIVIGVGGFLGMGEHEVAVNFDSLRIAQDTNDKTVISVNATKDSLKAAPEWRWLGDRSGTAGNSSAPTRQPVTK